MRNLIIGRCVFAAVILTALPLLVGAGPVPDPVAEPRGEPSGASGEVLMPDQPIKHQTISPMMKEIKATMAASDELLAGLQQQLNSVSNESEALRLLRAIHQQKQDTEISILRIQERYARQAGDIETADRINLAVDEILNPPVRIPSAQAQAEREARTSGGSHHE